MARTVTSVSDNTVVGDSLAEEAAERALVKEKGGEQDTDNVGHLSKLVQRLLVLSETSNTTSNTDDAVRKQSGVACRCAYDSYLLNAYNSTTNPQGIVQLAYAENRLLWHDVIEPKLRACRNVPESVSRYEYAYGSVELRNQFAKLCFRTSSKSLKPENLVMTSGCEAALDLLLRCVTDPGDGVAVLVPTYHGFLSAIERRNLLHAVRVEVPISRTLPSTEHLCTLLESAITKSQHSVKALLLSSPHSPWGKCWPRSTLLSLVSLTQRLNLHLIVDEALSFNVFRELRVQPSGGLPQENCSPFMSLFGESEKHQHVHVVNGLGKLGLAGFKIGALYTCNSSVLQACQALAAGAPISTDTQYALASMLRDQTFTNVWVRTNVERLTSAYRLCSEALEDNSIPFVPVECGLTLMLDLRSALRDMLGSTPHLSADAAEHKLFERLLHEASVLLAPSKQFGGHERGWFRMLFSAEQSEVLLAVSRIGTFLAREFPSVLAVAAAERLEKMWKRTDTIFALIDGDADDRFLLRPIQLRHPFLFYIGHQVAFNFVQLKLALGEEAGRSLNEEFDALFARGIDPDVETGKCHPHSCSASYSAWPSLSSVLEYRDAVRQRMVELLPRLVALDDGDSAILCKGRLLHMLMEHELMHQETLLYMMNQVPPELLRSPESLGLVAPLDDCQSEEHSFDECKFVSIPAGKTRLGAELDDICFGWDNEFPSHSLLVDAFEVMSLPVTNAQFLEFVKAGGYSNEALWSAADWQWIDSKGIAHPALWSYNRDVGEWQYRALFGLVPLAQVLQWPVYCSQAEAAAYCRYQHCRLMTEAEWQLAAYGPCTSSSDGGGAERGRFPWGNDSPHVRNANLDFRRWTPQPVHRSSSDSSSVYGVRDLVGNGWEWTSTIFDGLPNFQPYIAGYPGYSSDFFDNKHYVLKGASWATPRSLVRPSFRNWYQGHYEFAFSKFRCVKQQPLLAAEADADADVNTIKPQAEVEKPIAAAAAADVGSLWSAGISMVTLVKGVHRRSTSLMNLELANDEPTFKEQFALDVLSGLSSTPKRLSSLYLYDDNGSRLYAAITETAEYYPTRTEHSILNDNKALLASLLDALQRPFNVVELGAGDGRKVAQMLREFIDRGLSCQYVPIDISAGALQSLNAKIESQFGDGELNMTCVVADNMQGLRWVARRSQKDNWANLLLFLGGSLGNYERAEAVQLLKAVWATLHDADLMLIGFDLWKSPNVLVPAYFDSGGVTSEFNFNLLERINRELGANFDRSKFEHFATFNVERARMESWLLSKEEQSVSIRSVQRSFKFAKWEPIHIENSHKYTIDDVQSIAIEAGFEVVHNFMDENEWFVDSLWRVIKE